MKQESINFGYDAASYANYSSSSSTSTVTQPLPGQPPLPPMPPPPSGVPPPPHVFGPVPSQVAPIQTWTHPHNPWQWITPPQTTPTLASPATREITNSFQRDMPLRGILKPPRRERFIHNRNNIYTQRNNFHRKNRRMVHFGPGSQGQFDQATYLQCLGLEWDRNSYTTTTNDAIMNHMTVPLPNHPIPSIPSEIVSSRHNEETEDKGVKIVLEDVVVKKNKQRKSMSQSYPSRPWNREDAERALKIENEYNKTIKAQSLIIKFPDPDLNKDIVRLFHPGIQNIHFQSPSGPRYCFIQMAENVNIDEAIKELEKIQFGVGHLKVERKSLRNEDNPMPEKIDPYTLYIGNLPESVNVNEVKSKFPTAVRVDIGYAQKMRNTRYAFIRYNSVDESISAYKEAHNLMWDTRSIIVRFRRHRGSTCLPGEPKPNVKKIKEEPNNAGQAKEQRANHVEPKSSVKKEEELNNLNQTKKQDKANHATKSSTSHDTNAETQSRDNSNKVQSKPTAETKAQEQNTNSHTSASPTSITSAKTADEQQQQSWASQPPQVSSTLEIPLPSCPETESAAEEILTEIKKEPMDYEEIQRNDDDDDDDDEDEEQNDSDEDENDNDDYFDEDDRGEDIDGDGNITFSDKIYDKTMQNDEEEPTDHLDQMFNELENMTHDIAFFKN